MMIEPKDIEEVSISYEGHDYAFCGYANDHITNRIKKTGTFYEIDLLEAIRNLRAGGLFIDVGAFIGNHSVYFLHECADSVLAIEPNPISAEICGDNLEHNASHGRWSLSNRAIHDVMVNGVLWKGPKDNSGMYRFGLNYPENLAEGIIFEKSAMTLDEALRHSPFASDQVMAIKIDVEGSECAVLRSAREIFESYKPLVAVETHTPEAKTKVEAILFPLGYSHGGTFCATPTQIYL